MQKSGDGNGSQPDYRQINQYIKDFLKFNNYNSTLECLEAEERTKVVTSKNKPINKVPEVGALLSFVTVQRSVDMDDFPRLYRFFEGDSEKSSREKRIEKGLQVLKAKHNSTLQSARQIFSIAVNCLQHLHQLKDGQATTENLGESIENYKIQLGKYHKILLSELKQDDKSQLFSEAVLSEHKNKLIKAKDENNVENIIEVLLSLRVNALQISPELRRSLVSELIKNDMFMITTNKNNKFVMELLNINSHGLKHAICALISVMASTIHGVEYLIQIDLAITEKVIEILKDQEDGSVTQRFCIAIL